MGTLSAVITSDAGQKLALVLPPGMKVEKLTIDGAAQAIVGQGVRKQGANITLPRGKSVTIEASFRTM
ncbi:MAG: hypothetical protein ABSH20_25315 [Tepidisphaeraceae bacterium]